MPSTKLTLFDVVNLVVGGIVGADIYIAASFGSGLLGPASLIAWVVAGLFAIIIALTFARCSGIVKRAGGPYAYARQAHGHFSGFITGWSMWLAEVAALCVFPLSFLIYLTFLVPLGFAGKAVVIFLFVAFLFTINYFGIKKAARINDFLTIVKLAPLFLIMVLGLIWMYSKPEIVVENLTPFAPMGFDGLGLAVVLIFWAYAGFEQATVVSSDIKNSRRVLPKGITIGLAIVSIFYLITNLIILSAIDYATLAGEQTPLIHTATFLMGGVGALIMIAGALISVSGSNESGLIGSARLSYAMAADGYFPKKLASVHNKYSTPHIAFAVHCAIAFFAAVFLPVQTLIAFCVFALAFAYIMVALSAVKLRKDATTKVLAALSVLISVYLIVYSGLANIMAGAVLLLIGIPVYIFFAPKSELKEARRKFYKEENMLRQRAEKEEVFLARVVKQVKLHMRERERFYRKQKKR